MIFSWQADGQLYYDMHAEPAGLGADYAESFEQGNGESRTGSFHAPFTGIHGWFWENRGSRTVTLRLHASGYSSTPRSFVTEGIILASSIL